MNFHMTLARGFRYAPASVRTLNYLMKWDAKFAYRGVATLPFDEASPQPAPFGFLCGRTENALKRQWQAIQPLDCPPYPVRPAALGTFNPAAQGRSQPLLHRAHAEHSLPIFQR